MKIRKGYIGKVAVIQENIVNSGWYHLDADNVFTVNNKKYKVSDEVEEYKVHNKYNETFDYTNEAYMDEILVTIDIYGIKKFYNQNCDEINSDMVELLEEVQ